MKPSSPESWACDLIKLGLWFKEQRERMKKNINEFAKKHGLTMQQAYAILFLLRHENIMVIDFAEHAGKSSSTIVLLLNSLEDKGLITRERVQEDRRKVTVRLTEKGMKVAKEAPYTDFHGAKKIFAKITKEENEILTQAVQVIKSKFTSAYPEEAKKVFSDNLMKREFWFIMGQTCKKNKDT